MALRVDWNRKPGVGTGLALILALPVVLLLMQRYEVSTVLAMGALIIASILVLCWPEIATISFVFLLYTNIPVLATNRFGVPAFISSLFICLLLPPFVYYVLLRSESLKTDRTFLLMLVFLGTLMASSILAVDAGVARSYLLTYLTEGLAIYWLMINVVRRLPTLRRVMWTVLAAGSLLGSLSLYQMATKSWNREFGGLASKNIERIEKSARSAATSGEAMKYGGAGRAAGPVDGANRYGQIMIVLLPLAFALFRGARSRRSRFAAAAAGALILAGVLLTYSRGTFLTLAVLLAAFALLRWVRSSHLLIGTLAGFLLLGAVAPGYVDRIATLGTAASFLEDDPYRVQADGAMRGRATEMLSALHVFLDHPLLGVGPGQYNKFYAPAYQRIPGISFRNLGDSTRRAHILYFEMAAETGIVGLGVFLLINLLLLRALWRLRRRWGQTRPEIADLATAFYLSIVAYLTTAIFLHLSYQRYYWFLLAMAGAMVQVACDEWQRERRDQEPLERGDDRTGNHRFSRGGRSPVLSPRAS